MIKVMTTKRTCSVEGCEKKHFGKGWCHMHYDRVRVHGDPLVVGWKSGPDHFRWSGEDPGYHPVHRRVQRNRGKASKHDCVFCSAPAEQWAYDHSDPEEKQSEFGLYSTDLTHYLPLCKPCHVRLDRYSSQLEVSG